MRGDRVNVKAIRDKQTAKVTAQAAVKAEADKKDTSLKGVAARVDKLEKAVGLG